MDLDIKSFTALFIFTQNILTKYIQMIYNKDINTKERVINMYLNIETLGAEISEIMQKKNGEKDLYKLDDVLNAVVNEIDDLKYKIENLKEEISDLKSDDRDFLYELEAGK